MKKIVLALAVVAGALVASASQVGWKFTTSSDFGGYTVYAFSSALSEVTVDNIKAAPSSGEIQVGRKETAATGAISDLTGTSGADQDVYFYILSADEKSYYTSHTTGTLQGDTDTITRSAAFANTTLATGDFTAIGNVPEPTSALLMLLGVAGLALKRKRA